MDVGGAEHCAHENFLPYPLMMVTTCLISQHFVEQILGGKFATAEGAIVLLYKKMVATACQVGSARGS